MKKLLFLTFVMLTTLVSANEFISYSELTKKLKAENKKAGNYATADEVKKALASKNWIVADVRTIEEWNAAHLKGSVRVGRQAPEEFLASTVLDLDDNFVKQNMIVVCNSASRASIEAAVFRQMGFKTVKIYDIYSWIDECNPVQTGYSRKKDKSGTKQKFGAFLAEHCYKK